MCSVYQYIIGKIDQQACIHLPIISVASEFPPADLSINIIQIQAIAVNKFLNDVTPFIFNYFGILYIHINFSNNHEDRHKIRQCLLKRIR